MDQNQIDYNLKETTHSKFSMMGHFCLSPDPIKISKGSNGIFDYQNGIARLKVMPIIFKHISNRGGLELPVENYKDGIIYGELEDGTYVD